jgi:subtilase-type serine protease
MCAQRSGVVWAPRHAASLRIAPPCKDWWTTCCESTLRAATSRLLTSAVGIAKNYQKLIAFEKSLPCVGGTYTWHDITSDRLVALPNFLNQLSADYNASTAQVFGEFGYQFNVGQFGFEPFVDLAYIDLHTDGFAERGGAAALTGRGGNTDTAFTTLGFRTSTDFALGAFTTTARGTVGWLHAYGDITPVSVMSFAGGNPFTVSGLPIATDAAVVEAGLDLHITRQATLGISYSGQFGGGATDQSARGTFNVKF